jgi:hypothetical protein
MLSKWLLSLLHNLNLYLGLSLSGHSVKVRCIIHWVKPDFVSNFLKLNKLFVCLTNYNKNKKIYIIEEFKQCIHADIKTYIDEHSVSSLVEANTMADDYAPTHKLIYLKNKRAGDVPNLNYVQNRPPYILNIVSLLFQ